MKHIFALLLLSPFFAAAQECKTKKEIDQFSQEPKFTTGLIPLQAGGSQVLLSVEANKSEIDFFFAFPAAGGGKCFDDQSTATVFWDNSKLKSNYRNTGTMNCDGRFHFTFRNVTTTPSALQKLATTKIGSIQIKGSNNSVTEITLKDEEKQLLQDMVNCIITESKTLIKK